MENRRDVTLTTDWRGLDQVVLLDGSVIATISDRSKRRGKANVILTATVCTYGEPPMFHVSVARALAAMESAVGNTSTSDSWLADYVTTGLGE